MRVDGEESAVEFHELLHFAFDSSPVGMALVELTGEYGGPLETHYLRVNPAFAALAGRPQHDLVGAANTELTHPDDVAEDLELATQMWAGAVATFEREKRWVRPDGSEVWVRLTGGTIHSEPGRVITVSHVEDITLRRRAEEELRRAALHDPLTGLANRTIAMDHLRMAMASLTRRRGRVAVALLDLDHFKRVNDGFGHAAGDQVLARVAERIGSAVRAHDTAARIGGDEFLVVCPDIDSPEEAYAIADRIGRLVSEPIRIDSDLSGDQAELLSGEAQYVTVGVSSGLVLVDTPRSDPERVVHEADTAMYESKRRGRRRATVYRDSLDLAAHRRLQVEQDLETALDSEWFTLHYQPVFDISSGAVVGAEALLRIEHPAKGLLYPGEFIDVAEDSDLIVPIGNWVLREACAQGAAWARFGVEMGINVSARQLSDLTVTRALYDASLAAGLDTSRVTLEVTERALLHAGESVVGDLRSMTEDGVRVALDDFGTGYSSLTYLQRLPVTSVKIDRSFVDGLGTAATDTAIVSAVTALGHALGLQVVAEGVETAGQLAAVRELGCDRAQGFLLGRPVPPEELTAMLHSA